MSAIELPANGWLVVSVVGGSPVVEHKDHGRLDLAPRLFNASELRIGDEMFPPDMALVLMEMGLMSKARFETY